MLPLSAVELVSRDFKLKYRRSVLGVVWSVLNPLLMCLVYWAVFSSLMDMRGSGIDNFAVFLMCGQLLFNFFNEATPPGRGRGLGAPPPQKRCLSPRSSPAGRGRLRRGGVPLPLPRPCCWSCLCPLPPPPPPSRRRPPRLAPLLFWAGGGLAAATGVLPASYHLLVLITAPPLVFFPPSSTTPPR